jgi:hypothetical protein
MAFGHRAWHGCAVVEAEFNRKTQQPNPRIVPRQKHALSHTAPLGKEEDEEPQPQPT